MGCLYIEPLYRQRLLVPWLSSEVLLDIPAHRRVEDLLALDTYALDAVHRNVRRLAAAGAQPARAPVLLGCFRAAVNEEELDGFLLRRGLVHASVDRLVVFGARYPRVQCLRPVLALGSVGEVALDAVGLTQHKRRYVACLCASGKGVRLLDTRNVTDNSWESGYCFLLERAPLFDASSITQTRVARPLYQKIPRAARPRGGSFIFVAAAVKLHYTTGCMNYNIKGTGVTLSDELRGYTEKKLEHIEKFLHGESAVQVDIELEYRPLRHGEHYRAEFTAAVGGTLFRAQVWAESLHGAIDLAVGELQGDLTRGKKKRLHLLRRSAHRVKEYLRGWRRTL